MTAGSARVIAFPTDQREREARRSLRLVRERGPVLVEDCSAADVWPTDAERAEVLAEVRAWMDDRGWGSR